MLTISEVAQYAGVSVRSVRHYHQLGRLPEPVRDELGHRRYDAAALVMLRRISTLADAGVPLRRPSTRRWPQRTIEATQPASSSGML